MELITDTTKVSQKNPGFDSDSELESESASELNKSDSDPEYFPSSESDSSDAESSTSCSPELSKPSSDDKYFDIFPSIPKIYSAPKTYLKSKIMLVKKNCKTTRRLCPNELAAIKDPKMSLDSEDENEIPIYNTNKDRYEKIIFHNHDDFFQ